MTQPLPQDLQWLVAAVKGSREAEERLRVYKQEQELLLAPKLQEVNDWVVKMADELTAMAKANPELFTAPYCQGTSISVVHNPGVSVTLDFLGHRIVFEPFFQRAMLYCHDEVQQFGSQHVPIVKVTEEWARSCITQQLTRLMKADMLEGRLV